MRSLKKMQKPNDGMRTLFESVMSESIIKALEDLNKSTIDFVLIGGLAVSYYLKPRTTQDIDIMLSADANIPPTIDGFKKTRGHAFQHNDTHVEVEIITPEFVGLPKEIVEKIISTARISNGIKVASPSGLVASKLFRFSLQDKADIVGLMNREKIDLQGFHLPMDKLDRYAGLLADAENEKNIRDLSLDDKI